MNAAKALHLFNALEALRALGRDSEEENAPPFESRFQFAIRLIAGTEDEGKTRKWSLRVSGLHGAADWREVFAAVEEADGITAADGEVWPNKTRIRIENAGIELS